MGSSNEDDSHYMKPSQTGIVGAAAPSMSDEADKKHSDEEKGELLIMSKEDSKAIVRTKDFETFIDKTSKIIERALTGAEDILGPSLFLEGLSDELDGEETNMHGIASNNRDKLISMF